MFIHNSTNLNIVIYWFYSSIGRDVFVCVCVWFDYGHEVGV